MDQLGGGEAVVQLDQVEVLGPDPGLLVGLGRGVAGEGVDVGEDLAGLFPDCRDDSMASFWASTASGWLWNDPLCSSISWTSACLVTAQNDGYSGCSTRWTGSSWRSSVQAAWKRRSSA